MGRMALSRPIETLLRFPESRQDELLINDLPLQDLENIIQRTSLVLLPEGWLDAELVEDGI